jgi:hypothetical protein
MSDRDILKSTLAASPECLTPEQLEALVDGKAHRHLASCPRCQAELALLKSFESGKPLPDEGAAVAWISSQLDRQLDSIKHPVRSRARAAIQNAEPQSWLQRILGQGRFRWALPITAVAAVAIVGTLFLQPPKAPQLQANSGGQPVIYRSQEVAVVGPVGELQQVPQQLQWQAFSGVATYKVAVMEVDQTRLWAADTRETSVAIPASIRAKMLPGKPILWQVTAVDGQGRVLGTSQIQRFAAPREHSPEKVQPSR